MMHFGNGDKLNGAKLLIGAPSEYRIVSR